MKVFIVVAHPEPNSFTISTAKAAKEAFEANGHECRIRDLNAEKYNPISDRRNFKTTKDPKFYKQQQEETYASDNDGFADDVEQDISSLEWCDLLIFQFPLWWFGLPAALKGWVDRTFVYKRGYGGGRFFANGVYKGKKALVSTSTGGGPGMYAPGGFFGDINGILKNIHIGMFAFCGFDVLEPAICYSAAHISDDERAKYLEEYKKRCTKIFEEKPIDVGSF